MGKVKGWFSKQKSIIIQEFTQEPPLKIVKNCLLIFFGALLMSLGDSFFVLPMNIVSGGISSLAIISNWMPGMNVISTQVYVLIYTWIFFLLGLIFIGVRYSLRTLILSISYPLFVLLFSWVRDAVAVEMLVDGTTQAVHILNISEMMVDIKLEGGDIISHSSDAMKALAYVLSAVFGGALLGTGIGLAFSGGGSSGGTDVINVLVNRYFGIRVGTSSFIVDCLIMIGGFFANGMSLLATMVGVVCAFVCSLLIDKVFLGNQQFYIAQIISPKWNEINHFINHELGRGSTILHGNGGYTSKDITIIQTCFDRQDYMLIKQSIYSIDPSAFVTFVSTREILGYGFSRDKPGVNMNDIPISPEDARKLTIKANTKRKRTFYED